MTRHDSLPELDGRRVCIVGAGRSGLAAARAVAAQGGVPFLTDSAPGIAAKDLRATGFAFEKGGHTKAALRGATLVVVSPGVPWRSSFLELARAAGIPVMGEVELAWTLTDACFVAITGSNGKSTTTALVAHLLNSCGHDAVACGNIGVPLCAVALAAPSTRILVAEISSFQLEGVARFRPLVSAVLNITPDHLERHGNFESYVDAKAVIFGQAGRGDRVVLNHDDKDTRKLARRVPPGVPIHFFGTAFGDPAALADCPLPGSHNLANARAALRIVHCLDAGIPQARIGDAMATFRALPHRLEPLAEVEGVRYVNDSKATNVDAACMALRSYEGGLLWIAGGRDKGSDLEPLVAAARGRVRRALLIGEAADRLNAALAQSTATEKVDTLQRALARAREIAAAGEIVLLSPACSSYDQFADFEARGDAMRACVAEWVAS